MKLFKSYCRVNSKSYSNPEEHNYRFNIFLENFEKAAKPLSLEDLKEKLIIKDDRILLIKKEGKCGMRMNLNQFMDMTDEEFKTYHLMGKEFFDEEKYKPVSRIVDEQDGKETVVEIEDDFDPVDEVLKFEQKIGVTPHDPVNFTKNIKRQGFEFTVTVKAVNTIKNLYIKSNQKKEEQAEENDDSDFECIVDETEEKMSMSFPHSFGERRLQQARVHEKFRNYPFKEYKMIGGVKLPVYLNWEKIINMTPVKDQGKCNSCYAFSAMTAVEAHNNLVHDGYETFSEQEILDCSHKNKHCVGGQPFMVFDYIISNGITHDRYYPYRARKSSCRAYGNRAPKFNKLKGYVFAKKGMVNLIKALQYGPVVVVMYASENLKYYYDGLFEGQGCYGQQVNHSALLYGYNFNARVPYLMIKNVWGTGWGDRGHFKVKIGSLTNSNRGPCDIANTPYNVFPVM